MHCSLPTCATTALEPCSCTSLTNCVQAGGAGGVGRTVTTSASVEPLEGFESVMRACLPPEVTVTWVWRSSYSSGVARWVLCTQHARLTPWCIVMMALICMCSVHPELTGVLATCWRTAEASSKGLLAANVDCCTTMQVQYSRTTAQCILNLLQKGPLKEPEQLSDVLHMLTWFER